MNKYTHRITIRTILVTSPYNTISNIDIILCINILFLYYKRYILSLILLIVNTLQIGMIEYSLLYTISRVWFKHFLISLFFSLFRYLHILFFFIIFFIYTYRILVQSRIIGCGLFKEICHY